MRYNKGIMVGLTLPMVMVLSGCLGSSNSDDFRDPPPPPENPIFSELNDITEEEYREMPSAVQALFHEFQDLNEQGNITTADLAGSATYSGDVVLDDDEVLVSGNIGMTADFDTNRVSGVLDGFSDVDGELRFTDAIISGGSFGSGAGGLTGTLTSGENEFVVDAGIQGSFVGDDGGRALGVIGGEILDVGANDTRDLTGAFIADRD